MYEAYLCVSNSRLVLNSLCIEPSSTRRRHYDEFHERFPLATRLESVPADRNPEERLTSAKHSYYWPESTDASLGKSPHRGIHHRSLNALLQQEQYKEMGNISKTATSSQAQSKQ